MTTLFHFAPLRLRAGSIIEPGNFGRMLHVHPVEQHGSVSPMLARELAFEVIRLQIFASKPSRFDCCFACPTSEDARLYGDRNNGNGTQVLHEVEPLQEEVATHTGGLSYISNCASGVKFLPQMKAMAIAYWSGAVGAPEFGAEMLIAGPLRVKACLD